MVINHRLTAGEHLFRQCIQTTLRASTVVLATHQQQWLPLADLELVLGPKGEVQAVGQPPAAGTSLFDAAGAANISLPRLRLCAPSAAQTAAAGGGMKTGLAGGGEV